MTTIATAAREYASRPADERYPSVQALIQAAHHDRNHSIEKTMNAKELRVIPVADSLMLQSPRNVAHFTHWSFGQLCRSLGAPAGYLRELPPAIAADALNFGLTETPVGQSFNLLIQAPNGKPEPTIRACTSDSYGRLYDEDLYGSLARFVMERDSRWTTPPTWSGEPAGAYRGDRDSFVIITNGGSIVTDPSLRNGVAARPGGGNADQMYRGILISNSEVGARSVTIETILYRFICGNHMLWGAMS